jgi:DNA-binding NtrC family response regulator
MEQIMRAEVSPPLEKVNVMESVVQPANDERFAERSRIALMESDRALRAVMVRSLLRVGCVVSFKCNQAEVVEALQAGVLHGVVMAAELDFHDMAALDAANVQHVPIVVLTHAPPALHAFNSHSSLRFLQKPFDMRDLFVHLNLSQSAKIVSNR